MVFLKSCVRVRGPTHIVSFEVWYRQLLGKVLGNGTFATSSWASDDPHMAVVMGGQSSMDLIDRGSWCVVHMGGRKRNGVPSSETDHGHSERMVSGWGSKMFGVGKR